MTLNEILILKSSMDRFIDSETVIQLICEQFLKSSMDRFIVIGQYLPNIADNILKSSMDRFIVKTTFSQSGQSPTFKIQYG